eukprot:TRINITY_DN2565_c0_g1_i10.p1 TRINITY_DN2565_c0_g1~~TRINITY_DN2565_c0_g1_i10.p1  ORF type:complete len:1314 (+),score=232.25 TRINITY_DN2565_c0_g1_i10:48-3989(+)
MRHSRHATCCTQLAVCAVLASLCCVASGKQQRVLFIGNSYSFGIPELYKQVAEQRLAGLAVVHTAHLVGGRTLWEHNEDAGVTAALEGGDYDVVVLQDQSLTPAMLMRDQQLLQPTRLQESARLSTLSMVKYAQRVASAAPHAHIVLYETWGREGDGKPPFDRYPCLSYTGMSAALQSGYARYSAVLRDNLCNSQVQLVTAHCGIAWDLAQADGGGSGSFFSRLYQDAGGHPTQLGKQLVANVLFETVNRQRVSEFAPFSDSALPDADLQLLRGYAQRAATLPPAELQALVGVYEAHTGRVIVRSSARGVVLVVERWPQKMHQLRLDGGNVTSDAWEWAGLQIDPDTLRESLVLRASSGSTQHYTGTACFARCNNKPKWDSYCTADARCELRHHGCGWKCEGLQTAQACGLSYGCAWTDSGRCVAHMCSQRAVRGACETEGCLWESSNKTCMPGCNQFHSQEACKGHCVWSAGSCVPSVAGRDVLPASQCALYLNAEQCRADARCDMHMMLPQCMDMSETPFEEDCSLVGIGACTDALNCELDAGGHVCQSVCRRFDGTAEKCREAMFSPKYIAINMTCTYDAASDECREVSFGGVACERYVGQAACAFAGCEYAGGQCIHPCVIVDGRYRGSCYPECKESNKCGGYCALDGAGQYCIHMCEAYLTQDACFANVMCLWVGGRCAPSPCSGYGVRACDALPGCYRDQDHHCCEECNRRDRTECTRDARCEWPAGATVCRMAVNASQVLAVSRCELHLTTQACKADVQCEMNGILQGQCTGAYHTHHMAAFCDNWAFGFHTCSSMANCWFDTALEKCRPVCLQLSDQGDAACSAGHYRFVADRSGSAAEYRCTPSPHGCMNEEDLRQRSCPAELSAVVCGTRIECVWDDSTGCTVRSPDAVYPNVPYAVYYDRQVTVAVVYGEQCADPQRPTHCVKDLRFGWLYPGGFASLSSVWLLVHQGELKLITDPTFPHEEHNATAGAFVVHYAWGNVYMTINYTLHSDGYMSFAMLDGSSVVDPRKDVYRYHGFCWMQVTDYCTESAPATATVAPPAVTTPAPTVPGTTASVTPAPETAAPPASSNSPATPAPATTAPVTPVPATVAPPAVTTPAPTVPGTTASVTPAPATAAPPASTDSPTTPAGTVPKSGTDTPRPPSVTGAGARCAFGEIEVRVECGDPQCVSGCAPWARPEVDGAHSVTCVAFSERHSIECDGDSQLVTSGWPGDSSYCAQLCEPTTTPAWVWVLVCLGCLAALGACAFGVYYWHTTRRQPTFEAQQQQEQQEELREFMSPDLNQAGGQASSPGRDAQTDQTPQTP